MVLAARLSSSSSATAAALECRTAISGAALLATHLVLKLGRCAASRAHLGTDARSTLRASWPTLLASAVEASLMPPRAGRMSEVEHQHVTNEHHQRVLEARQLLEVLHRECSEQQRDEGTEIPRCE